MADTIERILSDEAIWSALKQGKTPQPIFESRPAVSLNTLSGHGDPVRRHSLVAIQTWSDDRLLDEEVVWIFDIWDVAENVFVFSYAPPDRSHSVGFPLTLAMTSGETHESTGRPWRRTFSTLVVNEGRRWDLQWRRALLESPPRAVLLLEQRHREQPFEADELVARFRDVVEAMAKQLDAAVSKETSQMNSWEIRLFDQRYQSCVSLPFEGSYAEAERKADELSSITSRGFEVVDAKGRLASFSPPGTQDFAFLATEREGDRVFLSLASYAVPAKSTVRLVELVCSPEKREAVANLLGNSLPISFVMAASMLVTRDP